MQPDISYLICATPRSGSRLLCEALKGTGIAGLPDEFFWRDFQSNWAEQWGLTDPVGYLHAAIEHGSSPNGVFGAKIMIYGGYIEDVVSIIRRLPEHSGAESSIPDLLEHAFPNLHYVWLTRRNKVRQAVSHVKAVQTGIWVEGRPRNAAEEKTPQFDFEAIDREVQEIVMQEASWQEFLSAAAIRPFVVVYEDFVDTIQETVEAILRFLGVPTSTTPSGVAPNMQRQADALSDEWVERYLERKEPYYRRLVFENLRKST